MRADVRIIDAAKRAALSRMLLESIVSTAPGEKLDEKLSALALPADFVECTSVRLIECPAYMTLTMSLVPPPSSDEATWWDGPGKFCKSSVSSCS